MVYAGIDVHRKRSQVSLVDGDGKELLNRNVDNGSDAMLDILEGTVYARVTTTS